MKKLLSFLLVLIMAFVLTGCNLGLGGNNGGNNGGNTEQTIDLDTVYAAVAGQIANKDGLENNITLPTSYGDVIIIWTSTNESVISSDGRINRPDVDTNVVLKCDLYHGSDHKQFNLEVTVRAKDKEAVDFVSAFAAVNAAIANKDAIVSDITLPTADGDISIRWVSSNPNVISNTGKVTRPDADTQVTLSCVMTCDGESQTFTVTVTVKAKEQVQPAFDFDGAFNKISNAITNKDAVVSDMTLPLSQDGATVLWTSSNTAVISDAGKVTRPDADTQVTLNCALTYGSDTRYYSLTVTVKAKEQVQPAFDFDAAFATIQNQFASDALVEADLTLPATANGATVTWASKNTAVIDNTGKVTRPDENTTVVLECTLAKDGETRKYEVSVTVKAKEQVQPAFDFDAAFATIQNQFASDALVEADLTLPATANGATVTWASKNTAVIDNTGKVTRPDENTTVVLECTLAKDGETRKYEVSVTVKAKDAAPQPVYNTVAEVKAGTVGETYLTKAVVVAISKAGVLVKDNTGYIYVYLGNSYANDLVVGNIVALNGKTSTYGGAVQFNAPQYTVEGNEEVVYPTPTELDIDAYEDLVTNPVEIQYVTLEAVLRKSGNYYNLVVDGSSISGSLVNPAMDVTELNGQNVDVTGYFVYVTGSSTKYIYFIATEVKLAEEQGNTEIELSTIEDVIASPTGQVYKVRGIVIAVASEAALICDDSGAIYSYFGSDFAKDLVIGDQVEVEGQTSAYGGAIQFNRPTYTKGEHLDIELPEPELLSVEEYEALQAEEKVEIEYIKLEANLTISGKYHNLTVNGSNLKASLVAPIEDLSELSGKTVIVTGFFIYVSGSSTKYTYIIATDVTEKVVDPNATLEEIIESVRAIDGLRTVHSLSLFTKVEDFDITWTSSDEDVLSNDGVCVIPEVGTYVTLTAHISNGELEADEVVRIFVDGFTQIRKALDAGTGYSVAVKGTVVASVSGFGFILGQDNYYLYVYLGSKYEGELEIGDVVVARGFLKEYNDELEMAQLVNYYKTNETSDYEVAYEKLSGEEFENVYYQGVRPVEVAGRLEISGRYANLHVPGCSYLTGSLTKGAELYAAFDGKPVVVKGFYINVSFGDTNYASLLVTSVEENTNAEFVSVTVTYDGTKATLSANVADLTKVLVGEEVVLTFECVEGYAVSDVTINDDNIYFEGNVVSYFVTDDCTIAVEFDEASKVHLAQIKEDLLSVSGLETTHNLTLPTSYEELTLTWVSSLPAVISNEGICVVPDEDTEVLFTISIAGADGTVLDTVQITIVAKGLTPISELEADYELHAVKGTVVAIVPNTGFLVEEDGSYVYAYIGDNYTNDLVIGDEVVVRGYVSEYYGSLEFNYFVNYYKTGANAVNHNYQEVDGEDFNGMKEDSSVRPIEFVARLVLNGRYANLVVPYADNVIGSILSANGLYDEYDGKIVSIKGYLVFVSYDGYEGAPYYASIAVNDISEVEDFASVELQVLYDVNHATLVSSADLSAVMPGEVITLSFDNPNGYIVKGAALTGEGQAVIVDNYTVIVAIESNSRLDIYLKDAKSIDLSVSEENAPSNVVLVYAYGTNANGEFTDELVEAAYANGHITAQLSIVPNAMYVFELKEGVEFSSVEALEYNDVLRQSFEIRPNSVSQMYWQDLGTLEEPVTIDKAFYYADALVPGQSIYGFYITGRVTSITDNDGEAVVVLQGDMCALKVFYIYDRYGNEVYSVNNCPFEVGDQIVVSCALTREDDASLATGMISAHLELINGEPAPVTTHFEATILGGVREGATLFVIAFYDDGSYGVEEATFEDGLVKADFDREVYSFEIREYMLEEGQTAPSDLDAYYRSSETINNYTYQVVLRLPQDFTWSKLLTVNEDGTWTVQVTLNFVEDLINPELYLDDVRIFGFKDGVRDEKSYSEESILYEDNWEFVQDADGVVVTVTVPQELVQLYASEFYYGANYKGGIAIDLYVSLFEDGYDISYNDHFLGSFFFFRSLLDVLETEGEGTLDNPLTAADAYALCNYLPEGVWSNAEFYIEGIAFDNPTDTYCNFSLVVDENTNLLVYGLSTHDGLYQYGSNYNLVQGLPVAQGDKVMVLAKAYHYVAKDGSVTLELKDAKLIKVNDADEAYELVPEPTALYAIQAIAEPAVGTYKFGLYQALIGDGKWLFATGTVNGSEYLATSEDAEDAADFVIELVEGETDQYLIKVGEKFVEVYENASKKVRIHLVDEATGAWLFNTDANVFTYTLSGCQNASNDAEYYLGTYSSYNTISASKISYITGDNASKVGVSQFPALFGSLEEITE